MSDLQAFLEKRVRVISTDGRLFEGILQGFDKSTNIILSGCIERIIEQDDTEETRDIPVGLYVMRGGTVVCVGEVDEELDQKVDWSRVKGHELKDTKND